MHQFLITALVMVSQQPTLPPWEQRLIAIEKRMDVLEAFGRQARLEAQTIIDAGKIVQANQRERLELLDDRVRKLESTESPATLPASGLATADDVSRLATPEDVRRVVDAIAKPGGPDWTVIGTVLGGVLLTVGNSYLNRRSVRKRFDEVVMKQEFVPKNTVVPNASGMESVNAITMR